jgi:polar amino acid transport system substrate-binding protein
MCEKNYSLMRFVLTMLCGFCLCWSLQAKTYVIGIEQLDYYPHYDFKSAQPRGYFFDLMQLYSQWSGDKFVFKALPVKRLYKDSVELTDFVYPDNKAWQPHLGVDEQITKYYSAPVIYTLGATMVLPHKQQMRLSEFKVLANIHGFSPTLWMELKKHSKFTILDVPDAESALRMTIRHRVDAANVEYNVALYHLEQMKLPGALVMAEHLPFSNLAFHLSSQKHPEQIRRFNQFLIEQQDQIQQLKQRYALVEYREQLPTLPVSQQVKAEIHQ